MQLWVVFSPEEQRAYGHVITEIKQYPQCKMLVIQYCAGEHNHMQFVEDKMYDVLDDFAKNTQCAGIELIGRPGWGKHVKKRGYEIQSVMYQKFFKDQKMSILRHKKFALADGGVLRDSGGGGGGGGQPTQSTSYNTNVPEYAKPYVENMLQSTQKQIYNDDMTSFRPYTPYSKDINNYFADFSPAQKYAQSETANMQTPGGYAAGSAMTGMAGLGSLGLAGQMAGAGQQYNQMAQDPRSMQGFMSPYMQNVVDYQKSQAVRDYGIGQQGLRAQAARSGAFGGSRQAIQESEAQRALGSQLQGIAATGSQQAFQNAQQAQQYGANLGLQGQQAGLQGLGQFGQLGGQLASIGGQQQASDLARLQAQQAVGQQQQTMEQNKINQSIANYATAQQYPFMQLGIMNSMLRGLPLQQTTTATYQQQPSTAQQLTGLGGAALSYLGKKEGGIIGMKEGGTVPGFKYGDLISGPKLQGMSQNLSPDQNQARIADPQVTPDERGIFQGTQQAQQRMASNPMAAQQMAQMSAPPPQMAQAPSEDARMGGIAQAGGDMFNTMGYAGGGIIAFEGGGDVPFSVLDEDGNVMPLTTAQKKEREQEKKTKEAPTKTAFRGAAKEAAMSPRESSINEQRALLEKYGVKSGATPEEQALAAIYAKEQAGMPDTFDAKRRTNMALAALKLGKNPRGFGAGAIDAAESYLTGEGEIASAQKAQELAIGKANAERAAGIQARARGDIEAANKHFDKEAEIKKDLQVAAGNNAATMASAGATQRYSEEQIKRIQAEYKAKTGQDLSYEDAIKRRTEASTTAADTAEARLRGGAAGKFSDWLTSGSLTDIKYQELLKSGNQAAIDKYLEAKKQQIYNAYGVSPSSATAAAPAASGSPMYATNGKERIVSTDGGKTWNPVKG